MEIRGVVLEMFCVVPEDPVLQDDAQRTGTGRCRGGEEKIVGVCLVGWIGVVELEPVKMGGFILFMRQTPAGLEQVPRQA